MTSDREKMEKLVRNGESCDSCKWQGQRTCTYAGEESNKPVVSGKTVCWSHYK